MDKTDQAISQQSEGSLQSSTSSDMLTLIPIPSPGDSFRDRQFSELFSHYMVIFARNRNGKTVIEVLDLETDKWVAVEYQGNASSTNKCGPCTCIKDGNEIILYERLDDRYDDIVVLRLKDDDGFVIRVRAFKPKNNINIRDNSLHFFNDKLYLLNGPTPMNSKGQNKLYSLDFTSLTWTECKVTQSLPKEVIRLNTVLFDGKIYLFGCSYGEEQKENLSEFYELDLNNKNLQWKKITYSGSIPKPRERACMVADNGTIYVFGGQELVGKELTRNDYYKDLFEYDISSQVWKEIKINGDFTMNHINAKYTGSVYKGTLYISGYFKNKKYEYYDTGKIKLFDPTEKQFKLQLGNLNADPQSSDILFKIQDQTFPAHKAVLSARCQFFKNMFESGMMESNNPEIVLQDIEPTSFKAALDYIYTNKVEFTLGLAGDLLKLSDKWSFTGLKSECEDFLSKQLTPDNFKEVAVLTKHVETPNLEKAIMNFVVKNFKATKSRGSLSGLPQELYMNIIAKILNLEFTD